MIFLQVKFRILLPVLLVILFGNPSLFAQSKKAAAVKKQPATPAKPIKAAAESNEMAAKKEAASKPTAAIMDAKTPAAKAAVVPAGGTASVTEKAAVVGKPMEKMADKMAPKTMVKKAGGQAKAVGAKKSKEQVAWFLPELSQGSKKGMVNVLISGRTLPKTAVKIDLNSVLVQAKKGGTDFNNLAVTGKVAILSTNSDRYGFFSLEIFLPLKQSQVPVAFTYPSGNVRSFQIGLDVASKSVKMASKGKVIKSTPLFFEKYGFWGGLGVNYLKYEQKTPSLGWDLDFQTFSGPSIYLNAYDFFTPEWKGTVALKASPGATSSSDIISISGGEYYWLIFSGEMTYYKDTWRHRLNKKYPTQWGIRVGVQHHIMPFLENTALNTGEIKTNGVTMLTVGGEWDVKLTKRWMLETFLRWQSPVATGSVFDIHFDFGFDGSVGASYDFGNRWLVGGYWYGQLHSYGFKHNNAFKGEKLTGEQLLFFSNIDIRAGYTF